MGYWENVAAEIERVLGDQLNPTDAYGRIIISEPMQVDLPHLFRGGRASPTVSALAAEEGATVPVAYRSKKGGGPTVPLWDWGPPFPPAPGSERWKRNQEIGRNLDRYWQDRSDRLEERRRRLGDPVFIAPPSERDTSSSRDRRKYMSEDDCWRIFNREASACSRKYGRYRNDRETAHIFNGCMERATDRRTMCIRGERPRDWPLPWGKGDYSDE